jgi:hypothetical protein
MGKYLLIYHGGRQPETEEAGQEVMGAWMKWFETLGPAVVDGGNPISQTKTIANGDAVSDGGGANPASGYSVISADSLDAAVQLAKGCPHMRAGGSIEVCETMAVM